MINTLSPIFSGGSLSILGLLFFDLFFLISDACVFQSLCSLCTDGDIALSYYGVPGLSLFHNGLLHSLPK